MIISNAIFLKYMAMTIYTQTVLQLDLYRFKHALVALILIFFYHIQRLPNCVFLSIKLMFASTIYKTKEREITGKIT